ncbi:LacI family transcriptional regulator [Alicyclobacillus hesperidum subsp. aegles]|uniref:substrate-binding domain-containing protein n=1 Tax=Alicyclobacillus hesperidum TaxID=89784 RepID=UPI00222B4D5C|nr:substrate-binding domain-containing protein [Alicyclobacillus hesperidum]GLG02816.1 LacI family transcriptional regulator [Alicyclobacillus hesperidum subsp. aegles]
MISKKLLSVFCVGAAVAGALASAGYMVSARQSTGSAAIEPRKHYKFELITKSNDSPYWLAVKDGADDAAKKLGVTVTFEAPATETDLTTQLSMFNNAVTAHVDGIILAAQNPTALVAPVQTAEKDGIPVVTVDSGVSPNVSDSFLATNNIAAAKALAEYAAKQVHGKGQYAIIDFNQESSTGIQRPQGWQDGMKEFPNLKYVGMQLNNNSIATAEAETETFIHAHPKINLIFGANDRCALGIANAIKAMGLKGKVYVAGFDADMGEVGAIKNGLINAAILQYPYQMGYQAVENLVLIKEGKHVAKQVNTPYMMVTTQNVKSPAAVKAIAQYVPGYRG